MEARGTWQQPQQRRRGWIGRTALMVVVAFVLSAGACEDRGTRDAPVDTRLQDNTSPYIINMPDGFMNLALKCVEGTLVVAHTRTASPVVVDDSELCREGGPIPQSDLTGTGAN